MSISQEQPPLSVEEDLREYLVRRFLEIGNALNRSSKFPIRKEMPYKPRTGDVHYFGNPATHNYDAAITVEGFWGLKASGWILMSVGGGGGGDMLAANNLSDLVNDATARANLDVDQAGTDNSTDVTLVGAGSYLSLIGQEITQRQLTDEDIDMTQLSKEIDDVSGTTIYVGEADPGELTSASTWRIKRIIFTGDDAATRFADGDSNFDNIWDNHLSLSYS